LNRGVGAGWRRGRAAWLRIPRAGRLLALLALVNGLAWWMVVPPGHVPDEDQHISYATYVAQTGKLPFELPGRSFGEEWDRTLSVLRVFSQIGHPYEPALWSRRQERELRALEQQKLGPASGDAEAAVNNPPLYYFATAVPYRLTASQPLLNRIYAMRLVSVLLGVITTLCAYLFVREVLPREPWAWAVGGAVVAFQPLMGFLSAGVHPDNMVDAFAAAELLLVARVFRRGLTIGRGVARGLVLVGGLLSKAAMLGLVPVAAWTVGVAIWRQRDRLRAALTAAAAAAVAVLAPLGVYMVLARVLWERGLYSTLNGSALEVVTNAGAAGRPFKWREALSFVWQLMAPRLPFQDDLIPGTPVRDTFLTGLVGRFGWLDYGFPQWVFDDALLVVYAVGLLFLIGLARHWRAVLRRWPELVAYAGAIVGVYFVVGIAAYRARLGGFQTFEQPRYVLPLLAIYGATMAIAARSAGRWGRVLAAIFIVAAFGHDLFSQLLTLQRYYT
jgi:4-amino-4-deoxy-L-arabinose transferase-like glycosyltransferase